jgi:hypothetical protein
VLDTDRSEEMDRWPEEDGILLVLQLNSSIDLADDVNRPRKLLLELLLPIDPFDDALKWHSLTTQKVPRPITLPTINSLESNLGTWSLSEKAPSMMEAPSTAAIVQPPFG